MLRKTKQRLAGIDGTSEAMERLGPPVALFGILARSADRANAIADWGRYYFSRDLALTVRQRELVIDRTTARCGAEYEWGIHVAYFAAKAELTPGQVLSLATGQPSDSCWDESDRGLLRSVDALCDRNDLDDVEWTALLAAVGADGAVDVLLLCGWYHAISFTVRAMRLPLEPGTVGFPGGTPSGR